MKDGQLLNVRIQTERFGLPLPFSPGFPPDEDEETDDREELQSEDESNDSDEADTQPGDGQSDGENEPGFTIHTFTRSDGCGEDENGELEPERSEFFAEGRLSLSEERVDVVYEESLQTGMEGSVTSIGFARSDPSVITMLRRGFVDTAFVFESGKRHICVYNTPFSSFELCVHALSVRNALLSEGVIELDYLTELHGARTERCKMRISVELSE